MRVFNYQIELYNCVPSFSSYLMSNLESIWIKRKIVLI
jgi:hypothetical protein